MVAILLNKKKISKKNLIISQFFIHITIVGLFFNIRKLILFIKLLHILENNCTGKSIVFSDLSDILRMYLNSLISRFIQFSR